MVLILKKYHQNLTTSREYIRNYHAKWVKKNYEQHIHCKRAWEQKTHRLKYGHDTVYTMKERLRALTRQSLKGFSKSSKTASLVDCSFENFINYFKSKMTVDMKWEDVMNGKIHIDHIKPCSSFDLSKPEEQKKCFHFTNLQPLWAKDNISKSNKLTTK